MRVRPATAADILAMLALERRAATAAHWKEADYDRIFSAPGKLARVALVVEEAEIAGFIVVRILGAEWEIENIAIAAGARRRGLGTRLVGELLDLACSRGATSIFLEVRESNTAARLLYEKWAFVEAGRRPDYYSDPAEDAIVYRFSFPQPLSNPVEGVGTV